MSDSLESLKTCGKPWAEKRANAASEIVTPANKVFFILVPYFVTTCWTATHIFCSRPSESGIHTGF